MEGGFLDRGLGSPVLGRESEFLFLDFPIVKNCYSKKGLCGRGLNFYDWRLSCLLVDR